jgi:outer membrane protein OmpA-like peptidoglycan-associated protein
MKIRIAVLPFALLLAACSSSDNYVLDTARPSSSSSSQRAAPEPVRSAGPLTLAGIGSYMDAQETDLRNRLRGTGALVTRPGDDIVVVLRNDLLFNGEQISRDGETLLTTISGILRHYDRSSAQIQGYTDTIGAPDRNLALSNTRARAVYTALIQHQVAPARLSSQGFGETRLRAPTGDNVNEPLNRRIELRIIARPG